MSSDMPTTFIAGGCGAHGKRGDFGPDLLTSVWVPLAMNLTVRTFFQPDLNVTSSEQFQFHAVFF